MPLSTLRTERYRTARKTRSRPARYGFGRTKLSFVSHRQLLLTHSLHVVEIGRGREMATGEVRYGGIAQPIIQHRGRDDRGQNGACRAAAEER